MKRHAVFFIPALAAACLLAGCIKLDVRDSEEERTTAALPNGMFFRGDMLAPVKALRVSSTNKDVNANGDSVTLKPGETRWIADIPGPAAITHMWFTLGCEGEAGYLRRTVIRIYWDDEDQPSVEAPYGDFFGLGHAKTYSYACWPFQVGTRDGCNSYWWMPFRKRARISVTYQGEKRLTLYYQIDYALYTPGILDSPRIGYFHATYRQWRPTREEDYTLFETVGRGVYVGSHMTIMQSTLGWYGEGDDKFYVDGDTKPTIQGTGIEDYFGGSWGYETGPFTGQFVGVPIHGLFQAGGITNQYRYHIHDPVPFNKSIRLDFEHRGWGMKADGGIDGFAPRKDYVSTMAYWYQVEPHTPFAPLPPVEERLLKSDLNAVFEPGAVEPERFALVFEAMLKPSAPVVAEDTSRHGPHWSANGQLVFKAVREGDTLEIPGLAMMGYTWCKVFCTRGPQYGDFRIKYGNKTVAEFNGYARKMERAEPIEIKFSPPAGFFGLTIEVTGRDKRSAGYWVGIDCITGGK